MQEIRNFESADCRKTRPLLDDFIAEELSVETTRLLLAHLEVCARCRRERDLRLSARSLLQDSWRSQSVPAELEFRVRETTRRNWLPIRLAAGLMVPLLGLLLYGQIVGFEMELTAVDHLFQIARDHVNCRGKAAEQDVIPFDVQQAGLDDAMTSLGDFRLVAIQDCTPPGAHFTHYIFEGPAGRISIAVERRLGHHVLPVQDGSSRRMLAGHEVHSYELTSVGEAARTVAVAALATPGYFVYVIGDELNQRQTLELAEVLVPSLRRAL